ncbi:MAG: glutamate--cysteine ligase [Gammaproteobacteria bacterium]|nr:glutamate--cysteine ligase [Gammaproteobacteria bacterium]
MSINPVPNLTTAQQGPLFPVEEKIINEVTAIESWFRRAWAQTPAPSMSSVDLRHAGFKLAPVDTNLFPAGFNNLNPDFMALCVQAIQSTLGNRCQRILLLPENHTRNQFYVQNFSILRDIFLKAGYEVRLGQLSSDTVVPHETDGSFVLEPVVRRGARIGLADYEPCLVILNNDLSTGVPEILQDLDQRVEPMPQLGWAHRLKSDHFRLYDEVVQEFAALISIDPWLINPLFSVVDGVDFMAKTGIESLSTAVDELLSRIKVQYREFGIKEKPYVVVKADRGTYGMGVMMVHDAAEIQQLNRKQRSKMAKTKGSQTVTQVMIQEGVYSYETMADGAVAEPVVYMIGQYVVGGFYRVHQTLGKDDILNTPGMHFEPLAFSKACNMPSKQAHDGEYNRFYAYGVIARLAALAAAREAAALRIS